MSFSSAVEQMSNIGNLRALWHNYTTPCIYMITLNKMGIAPRFGDVGKANSKQNTFFNLTPSGEIIKKRIGKLYSYNQSLRLLQYVIMPDHIHLLIHITDKIDEHLGSIIARWKVDTNEACGGNVIFERGYNDQILKSNRSLNALFKYIKENPWRLAIRNEHPDFFTKLNHITLCGQEFQAYGNIQLLDNPFKEAVVIHRRDDGQTRVNNKSQWLYTAANGGVLVSPFISRDEKAIMNQADELNGRFIIIKHKPLECREKPVGREFQLCSEGRLLILAVNNADFVESNFRVQCLAMNRIAEQIAGLADC